MEEYKKLNRIYFSLKSFLFSKEHRNVFKNISFLSIIQISNYILPLITLPYLVNVLGPEAFGHVMFSQAFVQYFITFVDYGFNFSATRQIAINRDDNKVVSEIFCSVVIIKILFFIISLLILSIVVFSFKRFENFSIIYFITFSSCLGSVLFPIWLYQGLEEMKYITFVNIASKVISSISIFIVIHNSDDFLRVPMINSLSVLLPSIFALLYVKKVYPVVLIVPTLTQLYAQLRGGFFIFLTSISGSLYSVSNTFLLGILFNNTYAGYYAFAEKIIRSGTSLFVPLNNAVFPFMSLKMSKSPSEGLSFLKVIFVLSTSISLLGTIFVFYGSDLIVNIIKPEFYPSIEVLKILSPLLVFVGINNLIGFQVLYTSGKEIEFLIVIFTAGLLNLIFCLSLSSKLLYNSAAFSLLISESFVCICFIYLAKKTLKSKI